MVSSMNILYGLSTVINFNTPFLLMFRFIMAGDMFFYRLEVQPGSTSCLGVRAPLSKWIKVVYIYYIILY
jgi:hypothetical protein